MPTILTDKLQKVYPITARSLTGMTHLEQTAELLRVGVTFIQLREKELSSGYFLQDAANAVELAHKSGALIIINDRADIAIISGADGVHLGQNDLPPAVARKLMGTKAIIGLSTHNIDQVKIALNEPVDYITFGPVFPTGTKPDLDPITGLDALTEARRLAADIPLVAIGGINAENLRSVIDTGVDSAAVISAVLVPPDQIAHNTEKLLLIANNP